MSLDACVSDVLLREGFFVEDDARRFADIMNGREGEYKKRAIEFYEGLDEESQRYIKYNEEVAYLFRAARMRF